MTDSRPIDRGEVVLVSFPYLDTGGAPQTKARPALVLSDKIVHDHTADVIVAAISSRPASRPLPTDVQISAGSREHKAAGLNITSWIKVATLAAILRTAVSRRLVSPFKSTQATSPPLPPIPPYSTSPAEAARRGSASGASPTGSGSRR